MTDSTNRPTAGKTLVLFNQDFDRVAHERLAAAWPQVQGGFDLFRFPSQLRLAWFDVERFAAFQALKARALGVRAVVSHHEQFGALAAARVAERLGLPGTPVEAVLACQHKLHARRVLQDVAPEANIPFAPLLMNRGLRARGAGPASRWAGAEAYRDGSTTPAAMALPCHAKPIKAVFSVLAREVADERQLQAIGDFGRRFSPWDRRVLRWLIDPFERVRRHRLPHAGSALGFVLEAPVRAAQFNLDGYVFDGEVRHLGAVDSVMYPGSQAFMRFDYPSRLPPPVIQRAVDVARRFLQAVGFRHGTFNMEFFHDPHTDRLTVIEFNPRLASQFSDLYERVEGLNLHEVALALAHGRDPAQLARQPSTARVASSFVFRSFQADRALQPPTPEQREVLRAAYPDALLMEYPKSPAAVRRDLQWSGSCRHGILHLGGQDEDDLRRHCEVASRLLGWIPPYADLHRHRAVSAPMNGLAAAALEPAMIRQTPHGARHAPAPKPQASSNVLTSQSKGTTP